MRGINKNKYLKNLIFLDFQLTLPLINKNDR